MLRVSASFYMFFGNPFSFKIVKFHKNQKSVYITCDLCLNKRTVGYRFIFDNGLGTGLKSLVLAGGAFSRRKLLG